MVRFRFIDPGMIMGVVVSLVILAVGVFAFFTTINEIPNLVEEATSKNVQGPIQNITDTGNSVFNIIGVVLIIGAIMAVVGLVYSYVRPDYGTSSSSSISTPSYTPLKYSKADAFHTRPTSKKPNALNKSPPQTIGDYTLSGMHSVDNALERAKEYRFNGHRVKIQNFAKNKKVKTTGDKICGVYVSKWRKEEEDINGKPKFK